jgi:hypothetical protein
MIARMMTIARNELSKNDAVTIATIEYQLPLTLTRDEGVVWVGKA